VALQFRRGTEAERTANGFIPLQGEPVYATDTKKLYIGDGDTVGGNPVGYSNEITDLADVQLTGSGVIFIENIRAVENQVIITTKTPHGFATGDSVLVSTATRPDLNGVRVVQSNSISTLTYSEIVDDFGPTADTGALRYEVADGAIIAYSQETATWGDQEFVYKIEDLGDVKIENLQEEDILQYVITPIGTVRDEEGQVVLINVEEPETLEPGFTWTQTGTKEAFQNKQLVVSVDDLEDVLIYDGALGNRQVLAYDPNLTVWRNTNYVDKLTDLSDVLINNADDQQILSYNGTNWVNQTFEINNFSLDALTDVELDNVEENQILQYTTGKWRNVDNFVSLNQFADVQLSGSIEQGSVLAYANEKFVSRKFRLSDLENINDITEEYEIPDGSILAFSNTEQAWKPQQFASLSSRTEVFFNTGPMEDLEIFSYDLECFPGFAIYKIKCTPAPTTVTMYVTNYFRDLDLSRAEDVLPIPGSGIYAEMTPPDSAYRVITPVIYGFNDDVPIKNTAYVKVRNRTGYYQSNIEVRLTILQVEQLPVY